MDRIDAKLVEQEHRFTHILMNVIKARRSTPEAKIAAWRALIWRIFSPLTLSIAGAGIGGVLTLMAAWAANELLEEQNTLLKSQNKKIDVQNWLSESTRRSALVFELTAILDQIAQDSADHLALSAGAGGPAQEYALSPLLLGRTVALSRSLRPYRYLADGDDEPEYLTSVRLSPERGQLLISIASMPGQPLRQVIEAGADFSFADLGKARLDGMELRGIDLSSSNLREASLVRTILGDASLRFADLRGAVLTDTDLSWSDLRDTNLQSTTLNGRLFSVEGALLDRADLSGASLCDDLTWDNGEITGPTKGSLDGAVVDFEWLRRFDSMASPIACFDPTEWHVKATIVSIWYREPDFKSLRKDPSEPGEIMGISVLRKRTP